jgi:hypothetical protein
VNTLTRILVAAAAGLAPAIAMPLEAEHVPSATARFAELQDTLRRTHASGDALRAETLSAAVIMRAKL